MLDCQLSEANVNDPNRLNDQTTDEDAGEGKAKRMGFREKLEIKRMEKAARMGPDPWLTRKFAVGLVWAIYTFTWYVFVIRLCVPMIRMDPIREGGRIQGIIYIVIYHLLFSLFVWSYIKVTTTSPGYARDYVQVSEPPIEECELVTISPLGSPPVPTIPSAPGYVEESSNSLDSRLQRIPPELPILSLNYRYDVKNRFIRPPRSHNCRHCGTVVLNLDHHCPWIGHCCGAQNRKYFFNFLQASTLFELFIFTATLISTSRRTSALDGQQLAVIIISGFFLTFTGPLLAAHTRLLLINSTTIEDLGRARIKNRERALLSREFGFFAIKEKKAVKKRWNQEWGRLETEGNLWWLGSRRKNFESVMGESKLGWFLPIPATPHGDDGLSYVPNPRFSKNGILRKRSEWPKEFQ